MRRGKLLHPAGCGMQPQLQLVEGKGVVDRNGELAIKHETRRRKPLEVRDHVREITRERLAGFRLQENLARVAKSDAAEAVPLRLVLPFVADRNFVDGARFHRRQGRFEVRAII